MEKYHIYKQSQIYQNSYNRLRDIIEIFWEQNISITHNSYLSWWCNSSRAHCMIIWICVQIVGFDIDLYQYLVYCRHLHATCNVNKNICMWLCCEVANIFEVDLLKKKQYIWWCCLEANIFLAVWENIFIDAVWRKIYLMFEADVLRQNIWSYRNEENKFEELQRGKHVLGCFVVH